MFDGLLYGLTLSGDLLLTTRSTYPLVEHLKLDHFHGEMTKTKECISILECNLNDLNI